MTLQIQHPRLLITDDDRGFRETLESLFRPQGFDTLLAEDGQQAVDIIRHETVHLVLMDLHMPRLTGLEAVRQLRAAGEDLPCILITAQLDDQVRAEAAAMEVFRLLSKPVSVAQVQSSVCEALHAVYQWSPNSN